jgi:hypothetical protein
MISLSAPVGLKISISASFIAVVVILLFGEISIKYNAGSIS